MKEKLPCIPLRYDSGILENYQNQKQHAAPQQMCKRLGSGSRVERKDKYGR